MVGDSMIDASICGGKGLRRRDGQVWLMPRNPACQPIPAIRRRFSARSSASCGFSEEKSFGEEPVVHAMLTLNEGA
ncbi:LexA family protein [Streptomyces sp. NPDC048508]|uniref:LexA family protein n=1 Tax=Streptomyces sp. NPDC048508 TaxID=3365561 RepID=UPI0037159608